MTGSLAQRAELQRLARVLRVSVDALDAVSAAEPHELRELTDAVADHLHHRHAGAFGKAVAVAGLVPAAMAGKLAQSAMGPALSARAASLLDPKQGTDLARSVPPEFLADIAAHADLRRVAPLLNGLDPAMMAKAGRALCEREEWIVLGTFLAHVDPELLPTLIEDFDAEALLRAGVFVEASDRFDVVVRGLSPQRLDELLAAAAEHDLWEQVVAMGTHLTARQRIRMSAALTRMPDDVRASREAALDRDPALRAASAAFDA